jgi:hypothetical protein
MTDSHAVAPEEEPQSPAWLPALGLALFIVAGVGWSLCSGSGEHGAAPAASASPSASAAAAPPAPH